MRVRHRRFDLRPVPDRCLSDRALYCDNTRLSTDTETRDDGSEKTGLFVTPLTSLSGGMSYTARQRDPGFEETTSK